MIKKIMSYILHPSKFIIFFGSRNILKIKDEIYLKILFKQRMGQNLDLDSPKTFNEKLQWLKLYDRKEIYTTMVDKYKVKEWVVSKIGEEYIIPNLGIWNNFDEIEFDKLPHQFVLKCTHDSGGVVICLDKEKFDYQKAKKKLNRCLKKNYYYLSREWPYKNVKPRILAEVYMGDNEHTDLLDYKLLSFFGKVKCSFVCSERTSKDGLAVDFYDLDWNHMPFKRHYRNANSLFPKPENYDLMIHLAEKLSKDIPFVRVDFYEMNGKVYFGELTFYPGGGLEEFIPKEYDRILGDWINLNTVTIEKVRIIRNNETGVLSYLESCIQTNCVSKNFDDNKNLNSFFFRLAKKLNLFYLSHFFGEWVDFMRTCQTFVIFDTAYNRKMVSYLHKNSRAKIILYYWNSINSSNKRIMEDKNIDEVWTFDKKDSLQYNLKYNPQFYTYNIKLPKRDLKYDILFLGRDKGRKESIQEWKTLFEQNNLKVNLCIIENEKDYIPYPKYLTMLSESKTILDFVAPGQSGLTLRTMESLFLEKKLITNNQDIKNYDFYTKENIFIIGEDDNNGLLDFVKRPYKKIPKEIVDYYDYENFIKRFFESK